MQKQSVKMENQMLKDTQYMKLIGHSLYFNWEGP